MRRIDAHLHCAGDRVLYGSDMVYNDFSAEVQARWQMKFAYCESTDVVDVRGRSVQGLGLAGDVLEDLYYRHTHSGVDR